jgi:ABC-type polysaccharide/polyol phosphate transport system ATPase subunit
VTEPAIELAGAGKRFTKYDDTPMLVTRALRFRTRTKRSKLWALRNIDMTVGRGECVGVIGRNGSGKSTMLSLLAGVTGPTEGRVSVRGAVAPLISVGIGFHPELTGRENVYVNGTILGMDRAQIDRKFDELVDFAEVEPFIDTPVKFYSSGMQLRLGFAVAVAAEPEILLVDEVLAVGDLAFQLKCFKRMEEIIQSGATIVVVSHNLPAIRNLCPRTIVLHYGSKRYDGETSEAIEVFHDVLEEYRELDEDRSAHDRFLSGARFERVGVYTASGEPVTAARAGDEVEVRATVTFHRPIEDAVFGMSITAGRGGIVYVDSTPIFEAQGFSAGESAEFRARLPLALATGEYELEVSIRSPKEAATIARPPKPIPIYVSGRDGVHGVADLNARFEIDRQQSAESA